jgi:type I restriction enzyme R subunit
VESQWSKRRFDSAVCASDCGEAISAGCATEFQSFLNLQLAVLRIEPAFKRLSEQVKSIAELLEEKAGIPMVHEQLPLILDVQTDEWWQDVTALMLESVRKRLRLLVKLIDKQQRKLVYTDFEDEIGVEVDIHLPGFAAPEGFERFRAKARSFLKEHEDHITIHELRMNKPLTQSDLDELERMLTASGVGGADDMPKAGNRVKGSGCSCARWWGSIAKLPSGRSQDFSMARR